ncbi:hypothetical protein M433DRAFT_537478 [Acidomyces richmondensis BFW]|nr:MAG: hypothetical protein FE78DRAFT_148255 [Acidomyces sp. 'richmondensis']KYG45500.1 hypothetical protein M433DRAFT_537478 [Acidomyces richmondensis BFW]
MMSSRVLSRLLPVAEGDVSVYDSLRRHDPLRQRDLEGQHLAGVEPFHDDEEDPEALLYDAQHGQEPSSSATASPEVTAADRWGRQGRRRRPEDDEDVPESLLLEPGAKAASNAPAAHDRTEVQWRATQQRHGLHDTMGAPSSALSSPQAAAMWMYTNATNLDAFLLEVYQYYVEHGVWSIILNRVIGLLTELFVFSFAMFLTTCIDYTLVPSSRSMSEVMIPRCMANASWLKNAALFFFVIYWLSRLVTHLGDVRRLLRMHDFFQHVLGIADEDIQTVTWPRVVDGLVKLQNANIATAKPDPSVRKYTKYSKPQQRLDAESIANRLMRQDNYYIAIYNKEILDFTLPLPFVGSRQFYSKSLEWCIDFCLTNFIFDEQGSIRPFCLDVKNRKALVSALQTRLRFAALTSVLVAPFNIIRFCIMFFFRYYTEFTRNPAKVSARAFTPFAEWKIRQFNELDHLFQRRMRQAMPFANEYLKQFPKDKTDQICRFIAFVSGAIAAVLTLATLFDSQLFLGFEITPGHTAVFWLTVMVGIFGIAHGMLPEENEVHDPVRHLNDVLMYTNYKPKHWTGRLHSSEVRSEFSALYQMRVIIFVEELLSLVVAPWILLRNARTRCERIIDFFREHTVHVDGVGYQCNFAVFGFKKDPNAEDPSAVLQENDGLRDDYYGLKDDKMVASIQNFANYYSHVSHYNRKLGGRRHPHWQPPPAWPPLLSPPVLTEEAKDGRNALQSHSISGKRSGLLEPRQQTYTKSPKQGPSRHSRDGRSLGVRRAEAVATSRTGLRPAPPPLQDISESRMMAEDDDLRDAELPEKASATSDTEADEDGDQVGNAGVLGMLYQFSKAQTDKGPGVNI